MSEVLVRYAWSIFLKKKKKSGKKTGKTGKKTVWLGL